MEARIERLAPGAALERIEELFQRTTQFNTTGRKFPVSELAAQLARGEAAVFSMHVSDRFGDHGLVGAAVVEGGEIVGYALSCRVLGLGVEHRFLRRRRRDPGRRARGAHRAHRRDPAQPAGPQSLSRQRLHPGRRRGVAAEVEERDRSGFLNAAARSYIRRRLAGRPPASPRGWVAQMVRAADS